MSTPWVRLSVVVPAAAEEAVTAAFLREDAAARATGLVVEDHQAGVLASGAPLAPGEVRVSVYAQAGEADAVAATLSARFAPLLEYGVLDALPAVEREAVADDDWRSRWKDFFHVTHVGERVVVRPPWRPYEAQPGEVVVEIEPGLAFGTGGHQTTQLCLRALEALIDSAAPPAAALDVGCGSGVLAIGAVLLGVPSAVAVDVDPAAVEATLENAVRNGVSERIDASETPLEAIARSRRFPLVTANIISGTLLELRDDLLRVTARGGVLVLAGLLAEEDSGFEQAFVAGRDDLSVVWREVMDDWLGLAFRVGTPAGGPRP